MAMRGGAGRFKAAALIHRNVHSYGSRLHRRNHPSGDHFGCFRTEYQDRADQEVGLRYRVLDVEGIGHKRFDLPEEDIIEVPEPVGIEIDDGRPSSQAHRHFGSIGSDGAAPDNDHVRRRHARNATQQFAEATVGFLKAVGSYLNRHPACDLAHRSK